MKNFLKAKGYYIILAVCVLATCAGGVVALRNSDNKESETQYYSTKTPDGSQVDEETVADGKTPVPTDVDVMNSVTPEPSSDPESSPAPTPTIVKMTKPVAGDVIQTYAADKLVYNKTLQEWRTHKGVDFAAEAGTDVLCAYVGTISDIKYDPRYGDTIVIDHGAGLFTVYCGVKATEGIAVGKAVETGAVLGQVSGDIFCEKEDGVHIHFEVIQDEKTMDPNLYLS